ncbi:MAG: PKD domain-containing protein, partial [Planctomycetota bacterium]
VESGDRVASVSYSGVDSSSNLTTATYIKSIGGLLVWAAGNDGRNLTYGNRDNDDIIVAGATNSGDSLTWFSAYGQFVDVVAPGEYIRTTDADSNTDYAYVDGTSFACPLTAGLCALMWSYNPSLTPDQIETALKNGCEDLGASGVDNTYGYGRINVYLGLVQAGSGGPVPPIANFSGTPRTGTAPLTVNFTDLSTGGSSTSWYWTFGDTATSTLQNPSHTYTSYGDYTVSLTATGPGGSDTETKIAYISVDEPAPVANFSATPLSGNAPLLVSFTDQSTGGSVTSWLWAFGDGATSTVQNPTHTYTKSGPYTVLLSVGGPGGSDYEIKVNYISVQDPWNDLGNGLAGTTGVPHFAGEGSLSQFTAITFDLTNAKQNTPAVLVMGASTAFSPFKGGIMVPSTDWILFGLSTNSSGAFSFTVAPNNPVTSGASIYLQVWLTDAAGPYGFSASNGISQTAP